MGIRAAQPDASLRRLCTRLQLQQLGQCPLAAGVHQRPLKVGPPQHLFFARRALRLHGLEHVRGVAQRGLHRVDPDGAFGPVVFGADAGVDGRPVAPTQRHQRAVAVHHHVERLVSESSQGLGFSG